MSEEFDSSLEALDWRYSAAIVGLCRYLNHFDLPYNRTSICDEEEWDVLRYRKEDITEERYLQFAEKFYGEDFQHCKAEKMLKRDEWKEEEIKEINTLLTGNVVLKKIFGKQKFDGQNAEEMLQIIEENRQEIIRETFRNKTNMYRNYANTNLLFSEPQEVCRLNGYYVDWGKKGKSASYYKDNKTFFLGNDISEFDFIPFAFTEYMDGYFINYSSSLNELLNQNDKMKKALKEKKEDAEKTGKRFSVQQVLFEELVFSADFLNYDVELICKHRDHDFFETVFLRKKSRWIFRSLEKMKNHSVFYKSFKITEDYYIKVLDEVMDSIINLKKLDWLIEFVLKREQDEGIGYYFLLKALIDVNSKIYKYVDGGEKMKREEIEKCARMIAAKIEENKLAAYRTKLTSSLVFKDYDRVCQVLLQLSNYANVSLDCLLSTLENCEDHKNNVYLFIACLRKQGGEE